MKLAIQLDEMLLLLSSLARPSKMESIGQRNPLTWSVTTPKDFSAFLLQFDQANQRIMKTRPSFQLSIDLVVPYDGLSKERKGKKTRKSKTPMACLCSLSLEVTNIVLLLLLQGQDQMQIG